MQIALIEGFLTTTVSLVVGVVSGVIGAFGSYVFFTFGLIMVSGIMGFAVTTGVINLFNVDNACIASLVGLASAIAAVWLTVRNKLVCYVLILFTAILGADAIILSLLLFFNQVSIEQITSPAGTIAPILGSHPIYIILFLALFASGIFVQLLASRDFDFEMIKLFERWSAANR